jgi:hypothetical protein
MAEDYVAVYRSILDSSLSGKMQERDETRQLLDGDDENDDLRL